MMVTTDVALVTDPVYRRISKKFAEDLGALTDAFGRAWYKLCHRDIGPAKRPLGPEVAPLQTWQNPVPTVDAAKIPTAAQVQELKASFPSAGVRVRNLMCTAWASAATFRRSHTRGGANGARIRLAPQKDWAVNDPSSLGPDFATFKKKKRDPCRVQRCPHLAGVYG